MLGVGVSVCFSVRVTRADRDDVGTDDEEAEEEVEPFVCWWHDDNSTTRWLGGREGRTVTKREKRRTAEGGADRRSDLGY